MGVVQFIYDHWRRLASPVDVEIERHYHLVHLEFDPVYQLNHLLEYLSNVINALNDEFSLVKSRRFRLIKSNSIEIPYLNLFFFCNAFLFLFVVFNTVDHIVA